MIISRNYRGDIEMSLIEKFMPLVLEKEEEGSQTPICVHQDVTFVYIKYNNLYRILLFLRSGVTTSEQYGTNCLNELRMKIQGLSETRYKRSVNQSFFGRSKIVTFIKGVFLVLSEIRAYHSLHIRVHSTIISC